MSTHPTGKHLFNCVTVFFQSRDQHTFHSVHRLDRETSGVLLLAKEPNSAASLTKMFEQGEVKKCYFFISKNNPKLKPPGTVFQINHRLSNEKRGFGEKRIYIQSHDVNSQEGKHALTKFSLLYRNDSYSIGLAFPTTGRQHQIRVHAQSAGIPLVGDKLYLGGYPLFQRFKENQANEEDYQQMQIPRHALHAVAINLPDPSSDRERTTFIAPIPEDLRQFIKQTIQTDLDEIQRKIDLEIRSYFGSIKPTR
jgi:23S rRNA pseudouridine1911/1915/1917 synthase